MYIGILMSDEDFNLLPGLAHPMGRYYYRGTAPTKTATELYNEYCEFTGRLMGAGNQHRNYCGYIQADDIRNTKAFFGSIAKKCGINGYYYIRNTYQYATIIWFTCDPMLLTMEIQGINSKWRMPILMRPASLRDAEHLRKTLRLEVALRFSKMLTDANQHHNIEQNNLSCQLWGNIRDSIDWYDRAVAGNQLHLDAKVQIGEALANLKTACAPYLEATRRPGHIHPELHGNIKLWDAFVHEGLKPTEYRDKRQEAWEKLASANGSNFTNALARLKIIRLNLHTRNGQHLDISNVDTWDDTVPAYTKGQARYAGVRQPQPIPTEDGSDFFDD